MVFVFRHLTYFTLHDTLKVHLRCHKWQDLAFLWLGSVPLCVCVCVCVHVFFNHSVTVGTYVVPCCCLVTSVVPDSGLKSLVGSPYGLQPARLLCPWDSLGKSAGVGCCSLLQGIFHTQGLNPDLHCRQILYHWATREALGCSQIFATIHITVMKLGVHVLISFQINVFLVSG